MHASGEATALLLRSDTVCSRSKTVSLAWKLASAIAARCFSSALSIVTVFSLTLAPDNANASPTVEASVDCRPVEFESVGIVTCVFDADADIRLFLNDASGAPYGHFSKLEKALAENGERLRFAMNAGMYHRDRSPVGHYVESGVETMKVNTRNGPGNFHLLPNGVFFVGAAGAGVLESIAYLAAAPNAAFATQSGPMLVIDGALHPRFIPESDSLKHRNEMRKCALPRRHDLAPLCAGTRAQ
jgi:uncharacterized protein YigE (DUF2233 family)